MQPRNNGKFTTKSDQPRQVRSIRATDQTWNQFTDHAKSRCITPADLLEELASKLNNESNKLLTPVELEIIISTIEECLNLKGNATSKIKSKLTNILNMLVEKPD